MFSIDRKYMLLGGVMGAFITWTVIKSMDGLGPARATLLIVVTQILVSYVVEVFGMFGRWRGPGLSGESFWEPLLPLAGSLCSAGKAERKFSKIDLFLAGGLDRIEEGRAVSSGIFFGRCEYGKRILEGRSGSGFFHSGRSLLRRFSFPGGKHSPGRGDGAGGAGVQTADGAEGSGPWAGEGAGSLGPMEQKPVQIQKQKAPGQRLKGPGTLYISAAR